MFTGLIEEQGSLADRDGQRFTFEAATVLDGTNRGDSIAVNGCCLTVVDLGPGRWSADVVDETLSRTNLGGLRRGDAVNLERPLRFDGRLGGHLVQGHVDAVGEVVTAAPTSKSGRRPPATSSRRGRSRSTASASRWLT